MNAIILTFMNFSIMYYWIKRILYAKDPQLEFINLGLFKSISYDIIVLTKDDY